MGEKGTISMPNCASVSAFSSAVATSSGVAEKVAGIRSGWLEMALLASPASNWLLSRSYTMRSCAACMSTITIPWAFSARM
ncbi:hypothetical protein D3C71_1837810 [compost metagenome]